MDLVRVVQNSTVYQWGRTLRVWARYSHIVRYATSERVQLLVLALVLLVSLVRISQSDMDAVVKFLSFVVVFFLTTIVTWSLTDPLGGEAKP